jgi:hypothetical protein
MIRNPKDGQMYGTAAEVAKALGVLPHVIRNYARRDGLPAARMKDAAGRRQVRYPLIRAGEIEREKRLGGLGAPRRADVLQPA